MAFDKQQVEDAIRTFTQNPFWAEKFLNAPHGASERLALSFFFSQNKDAPGFDLDAYRSLREHIEGGLDEADLDYLIENDSNPSAQAHFRQLKEGLRSGQGGAVGGQVGEVA